jgi:hypothetical protein
VGGRAAWARRPAAGVHHAKEGEGKVTLLKNDLL